MIGDTFETDKLFQRISGWFLGSRLVPITWGKREAARPFFGNPPLKIRRERGVMKRPRNTHNPL